MSIHRWVEVCKFKHFVEDNPHCERLPIRLQDVSMTVQENHQFSLIDDKAWAATLPGQRGFVRLGPKGRSFSLALYHQLHCVNAIRFSYTVARDGLITDPKVLKSKVGHDNHCFQFIRQNILCRADSTPITLSRHNQTLSGAGFGARHRCKNWAQVREFVIENDVKWAGKPDLMEGDILMLDNE
ncbi:hypothetical protein GALMADRAFT_1353340 [Galerina marginata CBS 339.88]|uniref:Uncharacterized protein n=1 Tax=Galerina marginata (strain CBS 339.88) TaxID=685588 RepID=A0A067SQ65_GALM3|nr:hypothetical protein GALMADRAFT_1353340 [Galerina marginata CBS 339.88]